MLSSLSNSTPPAYICIQKRKKKTSTDSELLFCTRAASTSESAFEILIHRYVVYMQKAPEGQKNWDIQRSDCSFEF